MQTVEGQKKKLEEHEQLLNHRRYGGSNFLPVVCINLSFPSRILLMILYYNRELIGKYKNSVEELVKGES